MTDPQIYAEAGAIIDIAMGKEKVSFGRGRKARVVRRAENDPLGYWCGVEAIVSLVQRASATSPISPVEEKGE